MRWVWGAVLIWAGLVAGPLRAEEAWPGILWFRTDYSTPQAFMRRMPEYGHSWVTAAPMRIYEQLKVLPNACTPIFLRSPERDATILFSQPIIPILPNGLITTRGNVDRFSAYLTAQGDLRLEDGLRDRALRVAILTGRLYGASLDAVLWRQAESSSIVEKSAADVLLSGLRKLMSQREFDGLLGNASELAFLTRQFGFDQAELIFLPVVEATALIDVHMACAKSPLGEEVIARINILRENPEIVQEVVQAYRSVLPADALARYDRLRGLTP